MVAGELLIELLKLDLKDKVVIKDFDTHGSIVYYYPLVINEVEEGIITSEPVLSSRAVSFYASNHYKIAGTVNEKYCEPVILIKGKTPRANIASYRHPSEFTIKNHLTVKDIIEKLIKAPKDAKVLYENTGYGLIRESSIHLLQFEYNDPKLSRAGGFIHLKISPEFYYTPDENGMKIRL